MDFTKNQLHDETTAKAGILISFAFNKAVTLSNCMGRTNERFKTLLLAC